MPFRFKAIPLLLFIAIFLSSIWAYTAYDTLRVRVRTSTETSSSQGEDQVDPTEMDEVAFSEPDQDNSGLTPPATELPEVPPAALRNPGTPVSAAIKTELGIEGDLPEEQVFYATAVPDDTIYPQWYTTTISAPDAWDISTGSADTIVAVIDTGFALEHEDLSDAWLINDGEQGTTSSGETCWTGTPADKQTNGCDDDGNGFVDDWRGWDFSNADNNPLAGDNYAAGATHGTKSAGLVGARGNNNTGVASINWQTKIIPIQALYDQGYGYSSDITSAIYYAVEMGADVINMSLGGPYPDSFTRAAVQYALQNNVIVVASSGNCGLNQTDPECIGYPSPGGMGYPGRYPETIAVGATTSTDTRASFSSYGDELHIVAPGSGSIRTPTWSTVNGTDLYATSSYGTSFSAPIVAGTIAILRAEFPDLTTDEAIALLAGSADKVAGMGSDDWTEFYGWGRLNVDSLLDELVVYRQQLTKGSGRIEMQSNSSKPLISSNTGHTSDTKVTSATEVTTYCITTPGTLCELKFKRVGSSTTVTLDSIRSNNQGVAVINWTRSNVGSGSWDATVTANSQTSDSERLIIQ